MSPERRKEMEKAKAAAAEEVETYQDNRPSLLGDGETVEQANEPPSLRKKKKKSKDD